MTSLYLWKVVLKLSILLVCFGIALLIVLLKHNKNAQNTKGTVKGRRLQTICILSIAVFACLSTISMVVVARNITIGNLATGMYNGYHQLYVENDNMWGIECESALTEGTFKHVIDAKSVPKSLVVDSSSESGTLILNVTQDGITKSYNVTNTDGEDELELTWLKEGYKVQLSIEHTLVNHVFFTISW